MGKLPVLDPRIDLMQERELQLTNSTVNNLRGEADQSKRRVRELEEHIQSDGRAERLEESLKNTQERADEFEFQLSKLKQVRTLLWGAQSYIYITPSHIAASSRKRIALKPNFANV